MLGSRGDMLWYVIHVYSGFENRVIELIKEMAAERGVSNLFTDMLAPEEEVKEIKRGVIVQKNRKLYPGYIYCKMLLTDNTWNLVKSIPQVIDFLCSDRRPTAVAESVISSIFEEVEKRKEKVIVNNLFEIGEQVVVMEGPFSSMRGIIESCDKEKMKFTVAVSIFGRATPVELHSSQIKKV